MGGACGAWPEREGGAKPGDPEEPPPAAGKPPAENRCGQVMCFHTQTV